ncbi:PREDICTED: zinc transporter ZIP11-like [Acropora digitifera]|uniref:zinc transporter ZIP11-like n=1 Tax=Acropora digitifera TaxID=70779 RepID=UPI00077AE65F|nr:PREDICTED: zinc transporter ZIP11-like [Acropora digitifera]
MIEGLNPVSQALQGTLFTWGVTALGSALVFVFSTGQRKVLDASLGFAAGVMLAASYWSLLAPAIEMAETSGYYGHGGKFAFIPVSIGFILGAVFVFGADKVLPYLNNEYSLSSCMGFLHLENHTKRGLYCSTVFDTFLVWHDVAEGLAVGVGFGAVGKTATATFENARNLAIGIGIQNFPEGLAVSLPLRGAGYSSWTSFWYGQLSGMVEPIAGLFGAVAVVIAEPLLPYALAFAAGAMVYVVVDDIIPEAQTSGNGHLASCTTILGFIVMMSLDVGLG